jgi:hypothetical protein
MIYNKQNYIHTTYLSTKTNQFYHSHLPTLPIPSIDLCDDLLYERKLLEDVGSVTSSSYINSNSEHYDNALIHTYDNPIEYRENVGEIDSIFFFFFSNCMLFSIRLNKV